jgi:hypothetical protein
MRPLKGRDVLDSKFKTCKQTKTALLYDDQLAPWCGTDSHGCIKMMIDDLITVHQTRLHRPLQCSGTAPTSRNLRWQCSRAQCG